MTATNVSETNMETTASIAPEVDAFLDRLDEEVDETFLNDQFLSEPMSVIARHLRTEHGYAVCGPSDIHELLTNLRHALDIVEHFATKHLPVATEPTRDTVEVEVTGYVNIIPSGTFVMTGKVRGGELPNEVRFTADAAEANGILGALAAGETVIIDVYTDQLVGR